ncbi:hypothetical protein [Halomonas sp. MES3-P3E]|uniref:hypothetical protein n=1 Tax=Halomonas sp. MES3-P3E TaxID=2058321 RepID=UPI000C328E94|nr:hypothetical protein [Halomonas sp. MES3-P3E]PKG54223.1 hypothetical protein CXF87_04015 [Halomonas sp. MES3-P3E]|tara:strand:- start:3074 stop:3748 length:675 start_codon:yes stop_codon:yes gene_type:complete
MNPCLPGRYADSSFTALERGVLAWLDGFYQLEHLLNTRAWVIELCQGQGSEALRFAALSHDAERFFPGGPTGTPANGFDDPDYLFAHSTRSADIVEEWMAGQGTDETFRRQVRRLILRHEIGGGWEADILQAADALSFLEVLDWLAVEWVQRGIYTIEGAKEKLCWSMERIRPPLALHRALPLFEAATRALDAAFETRTDFAARREQVSSRAFLTQTAQGPQQG